MLQKVYVNSIEKRDNLVDMLKRQKRYCGYDRVVEILVDDIVETKYFCVWYRTRK